MIDDHSIHKPTVYAVFSVVHFVDVTREVQCKHKKSILG
jgi:hypothetical protein